MSQFSSLYSWWSRSRADNFITTNEQWNFGGKIVTLPGGARTYQRPPDYIWVGHHGYVFAPENPMPGLLPLQLWWNDQPRQDNFTTTNPAWQGPPGATKESGGATYRHVGVQGHVVPPDRSTVPRGVANYLLPIHSWWSVARGDNFTTTDPYWHGGPGDTRQSGGVSYTFVRHEGFAFAWHDDWQIPG